MTRTPLAALALTSLVASGCAGSIDVRGGPQAVQIKLDNDRVARQIGTLVAGDPRAAQRASDLVARESNAKIFLYTEFGMLALCIGSSYSENVNMTIGTCLGTIAFGITALLIAPGKKAYAAPLRIYNESHPTARFTSSRLDVE